MSWPSSTGWLHGFHAHELQNITQQCMVSWPRLVDYKASMPLPMNCRTSHSSAWWVDSLVDSMASMSMRSGTSHGSAWWVDLDWWITLLPFPWVVEHHTAVHGELTYRWIPWLTCPWVAEHHTAVHGEFDRWWGDDVETVNVECLGKQSRGESNSPEFYNFCVQQFI